MDTDARRGAGFLRRVLRFPTFADETEARTARFVAIVATAGVVAPLAAAGVALGGPEPDWVTALTLGALSGSCGLVLGLLGARAVVAGGWVLVLAGIASTTMIVLGGPTRGFGDVGMMLYPVLIINANLLLERRGSMIALGLILAALGGVLAVELSGVLGPRTLSENISEDFGFAVIVVLFAAVTSRQLAGSLKESVARARRDEAALAEVNRRLEAEAEARETVIEELEARNAELERFTDTASYELESPLVAIGGFLVLLERYAADGQRDRFRRCLARIRAARSQMARVLDDLLELSGQRRGATSWLTPERARRGLRVPASGDEDEARVTRFLGVVARVGIVAPLIGAAVLAVESMLTMPTAITLGVTCGACGAVLWLISRRAVTAGSWVILLTGVACNTMVLLTGPAFGFADVAMMLFPVLVIIASLLLERRSFRIALGLILSALGGVWAVEVAGALGPRPQPSIEEVPADFAVAVLIVLISAVTSRLLADSLVRSVARARRGEAALATANRRLEVEAGGRERLVAELETRNLELERFTYTVSHDLKTPLVTIGGFLGYLERHAAAGDLDRFRADLARIEAARSKMARMLAELLALSRIGRVANRPENVPFVEVVAAARERTAEALGRRGMRLDVADPLPVVRGDRERLVEMVHNLLDNAAKFTAGVPQPRVQIGARDGDGDGGPVFFVRDNGVGIEPVYHDKVFHLFETLGPAGDGTGVGLALVQRIVEVHGGKIWVESEGKGRGATFCFTLGAAALAAVTAPSRG